MRIDMERGNDETEGKQKEGADLDLEKKTSRKIGAVHLSLIGTNNFVICNLVSRQKTTIMI